MSKPIAGDVRVRPAGDIEAYPPLKRSVSETTLMYSYRNAGRPHKIYDESGLLYGEPISRGRTPEKEAQE